MNDVTSLEVSKELYEVSGWEGTYFVYWHREDTTAYDKSEWIVSPRRKVHQVSISAYSLSYLLRKLRADVSETSFIPQVRGDWLLAYSLFGDLQDKTLFADTPEDAAAKLAIELFKQCILKKEEL